MPDVQIRKHNNVYVYIDAEAHIRMGMSETFSRYVKGYQFMPSFKARVWDGKIRFFNFQTGLIYAGLLTQILEYCSDERLSVGIDPEVKAMFMSEENVSEYMETLKLSAHGSPIELRDYQKKSVETAIKRKRRIIQSPTSSGKSSVIYTIVRYLLDNELEDNEDILIVVPTINLVTQLKSDFKDYSSINGWDVDEYVGLIGGGRRDHEIERFRIHLDDGSFIDVNDQTKLQLKSGKTKTIKQLKENDEIDDEWLMKLKTGK